jgi:hypothetical protein
LFWQNRRISETIWASSPEQHVEQLYVKERPLKMQFEPRSQVLTGPELLELVGISPDELAMKSVRRPNAFVVSLQVTLCCMPRKHQRRCSAVCWQCTRLRHITQPQRQPCANAARPAARTRHVRRGI